MQVLAANGLTVEVRPYCASSIVHLPFETHGEFLVQRTKVDGGMYVRFYRGVPTCCECVAGLYQGKRMLVNRVSGQRFGSLEKVFAYLRTR